jgi:excisionase family DNA binding protein
MVDVERQKPSLIPSSFHPTIITMERSTLASPKHEHAADETVRHGIEPEYLTTREVAERLRWSVRTVRSKIGAGILRKGEHFFEPEGSQRRWKWSAVSRWLEGGRNDGVVEWLRLFSSG